MFRIWKRINGCFAVYPVSCEPTDIDNFYRWHRIEPFDTLEQAYEFLIAPTDSHIAYLTYAPVGILEEYPLADLTVEPVSEPFVLTPPEPTDLPIPLKTNSETDTEDTECPNTETCTLCACEDCGVCLQHDSCNCEICRCSDCDVCVRHGDCDCSFCGNCDHCTAHGSCECSFCEACAESHTRSVCSDCDRCSDCCECDKVISEYHAHKGYYRKCSHLAKFHTGFELEVECGNKDREKIAGSFSIPKTFLEDDGSLDNGFEIISQPLCQQCVKATLLAVSERCKKLELRSYDTRTCGFHVHISRAPLNRVQLEKLNHFISADNEELLITVARRDPKEWARIVKKQRWNVPEDPESKERYRALNLSESKTIEFRLFKGTTNANSLTMYLEFVWASLAFCNQTSFSSLKTADFLQFVRKNRKQYLTLYNFLTSKYDLPKFENKLAQEQNECALSF